MRVFRRRAFGLALPLLTLFSLSAHSQNLLINPGFERDLSGWDVRTEFYPPANVDASAQWEAVDALDGGSGSVRFRLHGGRQTVNRIQLTQCFAATPGRRYTGGGLVRTDDELQNGVLVSVEVFPTAGCSGDPAASSSAGSLLALGFTHVDSGGLWLPATASTLAGADARSVRFSAGIYAVTGSFYSSSLFDGLFDDAYLVEEADPAATWILPAAGRGAGAAGSLWTTTLSLANPGAAGALVTLKFLFHDADGRSGPEKTVFVRAGGLLEYPDVLGTLFMRTQDYGAIRITSSSASLVVQSETSTPSSGGTVGQAVPAFGPDDFASATPKILAPIREDADFRTNLVLANPTELPVSALLELFDEGGNHLENQEVGLPPLGMTQIRGVAFGYTARYMRSLRVSTRTPGGLVAAYASIIDNRSNDPRAVLPHDLAAGPTNSNRLSNPGFDHDLAGWALSYGIAGGASWAAADVSGSSSSGSLELDSQGIDSVKASQCVPVEGSRLATAGARIRTDAQVGLAGSAVTVTLFDLPGCVGTGTVSAEAYELPYASPVPIDSGGVWRRLAVQIFTLRARSASVQASANSHYSAGPPSRSHVFVDDVFITLATPATPSVLPSAAWSDAASGAFWRTRLTLTNPLATSAFVTLTFVGHDDSGTAPLPEYAVPAGGSITVSPDAPSETWGAIQVASSAPVLLQSETSTDGPVGGTVGQALPAFGASLFAGAAPKTLVPVRENAGFRTNLVLANPVAAPVSVHVVLHGADGTAIGSRDVDLSPLGMTQINRVASALGAATLDAGRISVSTATPGGLVAAYASVIDNVTNDPRTLLPR